MRGMSASVIVVLRALTQDSYLQLVQGTYAFLSARMLLAPTSWQRVSDDLEAFFHVLLYVALYTLRNNCIGPLDYENLLEGYWRVGPEFRNPDCGWMKKNLAHYGVLPTSGYYKLMFRRSIFQADTTTPLNDVLGLFAAMICSHYQPSTAKIIMSERTPWLRSLAPSEGATIDQMAPSSDLLDSHHLLLFMLNTALERDRWWSEGDDRVKKPDEEEDEDALPATDWPYWFCSDAPPPRRVSCAGGTPARRARGAKRRSQPEGEAKEPQAKADQEPEDVQARPAKRARKEPAPRPETSYKDPSRPARQNARYNLRRKPRPVRR